MRFFLSLPSIRKKYRNLRFTFIHASFYLTCIGLLCFSNLGFSQDPNFVWVKSSGSGSNDEGMSVVTDQNGNVYTTGYFRDAVTFDSLNSSSSLTSSGFDDAFICKRDSAGNFQWAKRMGSSSNDHGVSVTTDLTGNVYVTGFFHGVADFGSSTLNSLGGEDIFVCKLDSSGNFIWAKQIGGNTDDESAFITTDSFSNVYFTGFFQDSVDFDPGISGDFKLASKAGKDIFIDKLDSNGNFIWAKSIGSRDDDQGYSLTTDPDGNLYAIGSFQDTVDFNPDDIDTFFISSNGKRDIFLTKFDKDGNFVWAKAIGGSGNDYGTAIVADPQGHLYTTGYFTGSVDFDPGNSSSNISASGYYDVFVSKFDTSGNTYWARAMGGKKYDLSYSVAIDSVENIYTVGSFTDSADFDPGTNVVQLYSAGGKDIFISKLNESGDFVWAKKIGGIEDDQGYSIAISKRGNIYVTGSFQDTADFDTGSAIHKASSSGSEDIFLQKMAQGYSPLPLTFLSFTAQLSRENNGMLQWETNESAEVSGYEIQKSYNGIYFKTLGKVSVGGDLKKSGKVYYYTDYRLKPGKNYYRILQKSINENEEIYSPVRMLVYRPETASIVVFPNPASKYLRISINASRKMPVTIWVTDNQERAVIAKRFVLLSEGLNIINLGVGELPSGIYHAVCDERPVGSVQSRMFVKE